MKPWKRRFLLETIIFRFHVSFRTWILWVCLSLDTSKFWFRKNLGECSPFLLFFFWGGVVITTYHHLSHTTNNNLQQYVDKTIDLIPVASKGDLLMMMMMMVIMLACAVRTAAISECA